MRGTEQSGGLPYRAICVVLGCAAIAFGAAVAVGWLEVRRPGHPPQPPAAKDDAMPGPTAGATPGPYVQRVKLAEALTAHQNVRSVYRFAGGYPKCWAAIDSEGHKQTLGPWVSTKHPGFVAADPLDRPIPESVEGYVALFGPTPGEQTYRLAYGVTKVAYPPNPRREGEWSGFTDVLQVKLPALLPAPERPKGGGPGTAGIESYSHDGEERRPVLPGQDVELSFSTVETPAGKHRSVRLMLRFFTPEEISAAGR